MMEKLVYECEYCGKIFDDYDDCDRHEMAEIAKRCVLHFTFYDEAGEIDFAPEANPDSVLAIWCDGDEETIGLINRYYESHSWDAPPLQCGEETLWVFDEWTSDWCDVNVVIEHYQGLKKKYEL